MSDHSIVMLGLPGTGKSTFLAALWNATTEVPHNGTLKVVRFPHNREYVQGLESSWLAVTPLIRTVSTVEQEVRFELEHRPSGQRFTVALPDMSGEAYRRFFARREWPTRMDDSVRAATGVILFISPDVLRIPQFLVHNTAIEQLVGGDPPVEATEIPAGRAWEPDLAPCAVVLVDLLQAIVERAPVKPVPVAIVISAWDRAKVLNLSPYQWLERHVSLLHQFVSSNVDDVVTQVFGVSAQGGDWNNAAIRKEIAAIEDPAKRVVVTTGTSTCKDIGVPLEWLLAHQR